MIEYLVRLLQEDHPIAILSRGYGRKTQGMRIAGEQDTAHTLGDEPFQFYRKFSKNQKTVIVVGEERILAVPEILYQHPETEIILLDDAFQHRAIVADLNILLTEYARPFYADSVLPGGRLRESRKGASRANVVIVSKCPADIAETQMLSIVKNIRKYVAPSTPVFFTGIRYLKPLSVWSEQPVALQKVMLVSGIANPHPLEEYVQAHFTLISHLKYADHHRYSIKDLLHLQKIYENMSDPNVQILTTEKDSVKLISLAKQYWKEMPLFYLPIETFFIQSQSVFDQLVKEKVNMSLQQHS
jgi:tetraacyldisaccharide 4'-kinase